MKLVKYEDNYFDINGWVEGVKDSAFQTKFDAVLGDE